jgi:hypothetical protein
MPVYYGTNNFGYRHIVRKHGWRAGDKVATIAALNSAYFPYPDIGGGRRIYLGPSFNGDISIDGLTRARCARVVVVNTEAYPTDPAPIGVFVRLGGELGVPSSLLCWSHPPAVAALTGP